MHRKSKCDPIPLIRWILRGLELYREMVSDDSASPIEDISPSQVRHLLLKVLTESKERQLTYGQEDNKGKANKQGASEGENEQSGR